MRDHTQNTGEQRRLADRKPLDLESLRGHTPGPWEWVLGTRSPRLSTPDRGKLIVMDFARAGMQGAEPRFAHWPGINEGAPRARMGGVLTAGFDHPDARLIAAAPELLEENIALRAELTERRAKDALVAELLGAAGDLIDIFRREGETDHEKHERVAATFLRETGIHAPSNIPCPSHTNNERWEAYEAWSIAKRDRLNSALAALRGHAGDRDPRHTMQVPDGYVPVPVEPTPKMMLAGADALDSRSRNRAARYSMSAAWAAMIAAAPQVVEESHHE